MTPVSSVVYSKLEILKVEKPIIRFRAHEKPFETGLNFQLGNNVPMTNVPVQTHEATGTSYVPESYQEQSDQKTREDGDEAAPFFKKCRILLVSLFRLLNTFNWKHRRLHSNNLWPLQMRRRLKCGNNKQQHSSVINCIQGGPKTVMRSTVLKYCTQVLQSNIILSFFSWSFPFCVILRLISTTLWRHLC